MTKCQSYDFCNECKCANMRVMNRMGNQGFISVFFKQKQKKKADQNKGVENEPG